MQTIRQPQSIDISKIKLNPPVKVTGDTFFIKLEYDASNLYIQTPASTTKQGIVGSGKKVYTELIFENTCSDMICFFESLETSCKQFMLDNQQWFSATLDEEIINDTFASIMKVYKSGKFYLVKTLIFPNIKIYNFQKQSIQNEEFNTKHLNNKIMTILEIKGIKFNNTQFWFEIETKQILLVHEIAFDSCLFQIPETKKDIPPVEPEDPEIMVDTQAPPVVFRKQQDIYYDLYKEARQKALVQKNVAIQSFLYAKNLLSQHHITIPPEEHTEFDNEIQETTEEDLYDWQVPENMTNCPETEATTDEIEFDTFEL